MPPRPVLQDPLGLAPPLRLIVLAESLGPAEEVGLLAPLARWRANGAAALRVFDEATIDSVYEQGAEAGLLAYLHEQFDAVRPTAVIASRYYGRGREAVRALCDRYGAPLICYLDEDLFDPPIALGTEAYRRLRRPRRYHELYRWADAADAFQVTSEALGRSVAARFPGRPVVVTAGVLAAPPRAESKRRRVIGPGDTITIGLIGGEERAFDFEMAQPALAALRQTYPGLRLHFFGPLGETPAAREFSHVASTTPAAPTHAALREQLAAAPLDLVVVPLRDLPFNHCRAESDWADAAAVGLPVVASPTPIHLSLADTGAVMLSAADDWLGVLTTVIEDADLRTTLAQAAQARLLAYYAIEDCERRMLDLLARVRPQAAA